MPLYSYNRFRLLVLILLGLIFWKISHLLQPRLKSTNVPKINDAIEQLEDAVYNKHKKDKVRVKVYYEALCPDSRHFFVHHLQPVSESLSDFLNITLVPYGKATTVEKDGHYEFECQHGENECYANKIHACSIDIIKEATKCVDFATCMITDNSDPEAALERCGSEQNVETEDISECANSEKGSLLLRDFGEMTHSITIGFIPTITLNESLDNQALILKKFLLAACQEIAMPLPPACL